MAVAVPYANPTNRVQWARDILATLGDPQTASNETFVESWIAKESGSSYAGTNGSIRYNPLNTTQPEPGSVGAGAQGNIASYPTVAEGLAGTAAALDNGYYGSIDAALEAGTAAQANASGALAGNLSTWGTGPVPTGSTPAGSTSTGSTSTGSASTSTSSGTGEPQTTSIVGDITDPLGSIISGVASGSVGKIVPGVESFLLSLVFVGAALGLILLGVTRLFPGATRTAARAATLAV